MFTTIYGWATQTPFVIDLIVAAAACTQFCTFSVFADIARINKVFEHVCRNIIRRINLLAGFGNALIASRTITSHVFFYALHALPASLDVATPRTLTAAVFAGQQALFFTRRFDAFSARQNTRLTVLFKLVAFVAGRDACRITGRAGFGFAFVVRIALFARAAIRIFGAAVRYFHAFVVGRQPAFTAGQRLALAVRASRVEITVGIACAAPLDFGASVIFDFLAFTASNGNASVVFALFVGSASAVVCTISVNRRTGNASVVFCRRWRVSRRAGGRQPQFFAGLFYAFSRNDFIAVFAFHAGCFGTALFAIRIDRFAGDAGRTA